MPRDLWKTARNSDVAKRATVEVARCLDRGGGYPFIVATDKQMFLSSGNHYSEVRYSAPFRFYRAKAEDDSFFWVELTTGELLAIRKRDSIRGPFVIPSGRPIWIFDSEWQPRQSEVTMFYEDVDDIDGNGLLYFKARDGNRIAVEQANLRSPVTLIERPSHRYFA